MEIKMSKKNIMVVQCRASESEREIRRLKEIETVKEEDRCIDRWRVRKRYI